MSESLNSKMEFDHVIEVHTDGTVSGSTLNPYFDLHMTETSAGHWQDEFTIPIGWELMTGYTGQYSYNGPVMHISEYIGGRMARDILETPGYYVALTVESHDMHRWELDGDGTEWCPQCGDARNTEESDVCQSNEPAGWVVAFKPAE